MIPRVSATACGTGIELFKNMSAVFNGSAYLCIHTGMYPTYIDGEERGRLLEKESQFTCDQIYRTP